VSQTGYLQRVLLLLQRGCNLHLTVLRLLLLLLLLLLLQRGCNLHLTVLRRPWVLLLVLLLLLRRP
jgi:hypothetical protein